MEWLWAEREGGETAHARFARLAATPPDAPFWTVLPGDPGPERIFDAPVYERGAMTLHALRSEIGDDAFLRLLREWAGRHAGQAVTTERFTALAEEVSGRQLDDFFRTWLVTAKRPAD